MTDRIVNARAALPLAVGLLLSCGTAWAQVPAAPASGDAAESPAPDAAGGSPLTAQGAGGEGDILVTARRRNERLIDTPVAITAIGGQTLQNYSVNRVSDIATLVPSLIAGKAASGSSASVFLRGVGSTALSAGFDQSVSFVIDNLPMSRGREISLPQFDIKGVEVLKGPQALFFGKNTTAGLISITSNGPGDTLEAGGKAGYGFKAREKYGEAYISGPLTDRLGARLAGRYSDADGAFRNTAADVSFDPLGRRQERLYDRRGRAESYSGRLTLDWQPTDTLTMELKTAASWLNDGGPTDLVERVCGGGRTTPTNASPNTGCRIDGRADVATLPREVLPGYRYINDSGVPYARFRSQSAVLTTRLATDPMDITSVTSFYHFRQKDLSNVAGEGFPATFTQYADFNQYSQEVRAETKMEGPFNLLAGAFYSHGKFVFNTDAYFIPLPFDTVNGTAVSFKRDNGFASDSLSAFLQGTLELGRFELTAGARYSTERRQSYQRSLPANSLLAAVFPGNISLRDNFNDEDLSPEITLRYKPGVDTTVYAAYKRGFKTGGFNISQALTPAASVQAGRFGSETAEGGELGLRTLLLDRRLSLNLTAYRYTYDDLQVQTFDPITIGLIAGNAGKLRTQGIEGDFNWRMVEGFTLRGAVAYNDAKYRNFVGQCFGGQTIAEGCNLTPVGGAFTAQDYAGRTPPKAPKLAGRFGGTFTSGLTDALNLSVSGDASYTSSFNFSDTLRPDTVQKRYAKIDAAVALSGPDSQWTLSLIGRNLTNKLIATSGNDIPFTGGTGTGTATGVRADLSTFIENPREIVVEVAFKF